MGGFSDPGSEGKMGLVIFKKKWWCVWEQERWVWDGCEEFLFWTLIIHSSISLVFIFQPSHLPVLKLIMVLGSK